MTSLRIRDIETLEQELKLKKNDCLRIIDAADIRSSPTLYHYTKMDTFLSIASSGKIRFSDSRCCNDPTEISLGLDIYTQIHNELIESLVRKNRLFALFMALIKNAIHLSFCREGEEEVIRYNFNEWAKKNDFPSPENMPPLERAAVFLFCLSEKPNNLRQWIPYADDGRGVSIGFKGIKDNLHSITKEDLYIVKCSYKGRGKKEEYTKALYKKAYDIFQRTDKSLHALLMNRIFLDFTSDIIACKDPVYEDEEEWRLFVISRDEKNLEKISFYTKNGTITPFIDAELDKDAVTEFILGPKTDKSVNTSTLGLLSKKYGYHNATIKHSEIPYK